MLFVSGHTCKGSFQPTGGGSEKSPVIIGKTGKGTTPIIDGNGESNAILLVNMSNLTLQDLEIINAAKAGSKRNGVHVRLTDFGKSENITLQNLTIHHIRGGDYKNIDGSAGIQVGIEGQKIASYYDNLKILNNHIEDVDRSGIYFKSLWDKRSHSVTTQKWTPSTRVVIRGNTVKSIAGDGIKVDTTLGALIEYNTLAGFQLRSHYNNAGIWTFDTQDTIVQFNDVSGGGSSGDGMAFDADAGSMNTLFQYNYSHHNKGGFVMLCPYTGVYSDGTIVRYNISYNDKTRVFQMCHGNTHKNKIYNNSIYYNGTDKVKFLQGQMPTNSDLEWSNNIIYNTGPVMELDIQKQKPNLNFYNNDFVGVGKLPNNTDGRQHPNGLSVDPAFISVSEQNINGFKLSSKTPLKGKGKIIQNNGGRDYFNHPVSTDKAPTIGADEEKH
ncbi:hypothetical protein Xbed_01388 [Xenorhabdus beddingii]|uniref:Right handed beta helix domain-containing protein n=2 Tax=Xenorhabdus beddingii TaxID=40578 RepID=A0A1Y2SNW7_9GAMM|nr:hypothetical protein Xbed_01388 [Xenorhabdus beddingii]